MVTVRKRADYLFGWAAPITTQSQAAVASCCASTPAADSSERTRQRSACLGRSGVAGQGLFQSLELGLSPWLRSGKLVLVLTGWQEERYPLYAYYPSRHLPPAKIRAFLDFVQEVLVEEQGSKG